MSQPVPVPAPPQSLVTADDLAAGLADLGLAPGSTVLAHVSLSSLGYVVGGPLGVIEGLVAALGPEGTLVMPAFSGDLSDPAEWVDPPIPQEWWPVLRERMPPFDPARTPSWGVGVTAELFRTLPGVVRGDHPRTSFAALGPAAAEIVAPHPLTGMLGEGSPLGRLYGCGATVLLLGAGHGSNTSMHLAEHRARWLGRRRVKEGAPVRTSKGRRWTEWQELEHTTFDFEAIGSDFEAAGGAVVGQIGDAHVRLMDMRVLVDFAARWMTLNRR